MKLFHAVCDQIHAAAAGREVQGVVTRMTSGMAEQLSKELDAPDGALPFDVIGSPCMILFGHEECRAWSVWEG